MNIIEKIDGKINEENTLDPKAYTAATKKTLDAWSKYQRIYLDELMNIFKNKTGATASKQFIKLRDKIATAHTTYENLLGDHYQMAKKLK